MASFEVGGLGELILLAPPSEREARPLPEGRRPTRAHPGHGPPPCWCSQTLQKQPQK